MSDTARHNLGRLGEDYAAAYLTESGLFVLDRNWRCRDGELDLVATDRVGVLVCEVKTRTSDKYGDPAEYVTPAKALRVRRATCDWLRKRRVGWCDVQFDVLAILWPSTGKPRLRHLRDVF